MRALTRRQHRPRRDCGRDRRPRPPLTSIASRNLDLEGGLGRHLLGRRASSLDRRLASERYGQLLWGDCGEGRIHEEIACTPWRAPARGCFFEWLSTFLRQKHLLVDLHGLRQLGKSDISTVSEKVIPPFVTVSEVHVNALRAGVGPVFHDLAVVALPHVRPVHFDCGTLQLRRRVRAKVQKVRLDAAARHLCELFGLHNGCCLCRLRLSVDGIVSCHGRRHRGWRLTNICELNELCVTRQGEGLFRAFLVRDDDGISVVRGDGARVIPHLGKEDLDWPAHVGGRRSASGPLLRGGSILLLGDHLLESVVILLFGLNQLASLRRVRACA
mmetsp:Transcript_10240/g.42474  ORF Transcript_10240/g.42474 Transcript_10240/m.42474 type:complete len:329 (-) Transcript_10240:3744-4730(-)